MRDQAALSLPYARRGRESYAPTCIGRGKGYHAGSTPAEERRCGDLSTDPIARNPPSSNGIVISVV